MSSHIDQAVAARIAAARARREQAAADRAERAQRRAHGVAARHAAKLRLLAQQSRAAAIERRGDEIEHDRREGAE